MKYLGEKLADRLYEAAFLTGIGGVEYHEEYENEFGEKVHALEFPTQEDFTKAVFTLGKTLGAELKGDTYIIRNKAREDSHAFAEWLSSFNREDSSQGYSIYW